MRNTRTRFAGIALMAVIGALFVGPASALAQDSLANPSAAQYEPQSQVQGTSTTGAGPVANNTGNTSGGGGTGTLPFTGMDVLVLSAVALALIGTGVTLRRLSSPKAPRV
jgi:hypothetical protein